MSALRWLGVGWGLAAAFLMVGLENPVWLSAGLLVGLAFSGLANRSLKRALRVIWPVVLFAGSLSLLQVVGGLPVTVLPLRTMAFFLFFTGAMRLVPWRELTSGVTPHTWGFRFLLFLYFTRHFVVILSSESLRLLRARSLSLSRPYGRGSFRSLASALVSLFARSLDRAERFYAAQLLTGLAE